MKSQEIKQRIIDLATYYGKDMTVSTLDIYADHLQDMDYQTFKLAVDRHIQHSKWMPVVADIREAAMLNFVDKAGVPSPADAWKETSKHLRDDTSVTVGTLTAVNRINDHEWSHPIVKRAAESLGWLDLWLTRDTNTTSNRARYMDTYKELLQSLKTQIQHSPDLRDAIKPITQEQLPEPKQKKLPEHKAMETGWDKMPDDVRARLDQLRQKKEV